MPVGLRCRRGLLVGVWLVLVVVCCVRSVRLCVCVVRLLFVLLLVV